MRHRAFGRALALVTLGLASAPAAWALDCDQDTHRPVEQRICADTGLKTLDARVAAAVDQLARRNDAQDPPIRQDQANWWAETLAAGWAAIENDQPAAAGLTSRYRERLAYLQARRHAPAKHSIAATLQQAIATQDEHETDAALADLPGVATARLIDVPADSAPGDALSAIHAQPATTLRQALSGLAETAGSGLRLRYLASYRIGVFSARQGSANCLSTQWFSVDAQGRARPLPTPSVLSDHEGNGVCGQPLVLAAIDGQATVLTVADPNVDEREIRFQTRRGDDWTPPKRLIARYDHRLGTPIVAHRKDSGAVFWQRLIQPIVTAFDRHPAPGFSASALSPSNRDRVTKMRDKVRAAAGDAPYVTAPLAARNPALAPYDQFDKAAVFFPTAALNNWLLGRIGRAHLGWRDNDDWLLGFWTLNADDTLVPLASVRVPRVRTTYLGSALVPIQTAGDSP